MPFPDVCPSCAEPLDYRPELLGVRRRDWDGLAFRCEHCGIGFSNSTHPDARVRIVRTPEQAVPQQVHEGLDEALRQALNVRNRPSKRNAFCSATSEDAVTWSVFNALALAGRLPSVLWSIGSHDPRGPVTMLLWGAPVAGPDADRVRAAMICVSDELGENALSRSEPDVLLVTETLVVFIEAKTHSRNERDQDARGWSLYLGDESRFTAPAEDVQKIGYYELTRNWVIGNRLANRLGRDFALANLGPQRLAASADAFATLAATTPHRTFTHVRWATLLDASAPVADWLDAHARQVGLRDL